MACGVAKIACGGASRAARDSLDLQDEPGSALRKSGVGPGFRLRLCRFRQVAWIERSEIRERRSGFIAAPGFRSAQPGLRKKGRKRNAGKRRVTNRRILRCGARPFGARTLAGVPPRLSPRGVFVPEAQLQARLPGTRSERALPAFACPSPGMHLPPRS